MARRKKPEAKPAPGLPPKSPQPKPAPGLPPKSPAVEQALAAITALSPDDQLVLWIWLYAANAAITGPYRDQSEYLQERAIRAKSRPGRHKRQLTEEDEQILRDREQAVSWLKMEDKYGLPQETLRQRHYRAEKRRSDNYVKTPSGEYRRIGHGERVYPL
jgi:hypothetical protein